MRVVDSQDHRISCLREWESRIFSKPSKKRHWKPGRSAYSLSKFIMDRNGANHLESRISCVLSQPVKLEKGEPEFGASFDSYPGQPSRLDLGIIGRVGSMSSLFIGVEAKVDEPFGPTVCDRYRAAIKTRDSGKSTSADKRVVDLLSRYFSETDDPLSSRFASVRYQLLIFCSQIGNKARQRPMHVITRKRLQEFWRDHPESEKPLKAWFAIMRLRRYSTPHEMRQDFPSASFLGQWRTVFNIGGNKYRLIVDMRYDLGRVYIRHVLTHSEYDRRTQTGTL